MAHSWRRNQLAVTGASFIGFTGFTLVMPFLPLYIRDLGVADVGAIALWSGLSLGATPAVTALMSPFWGRLADRFGRKVMVQRALASFVVTMIVMAFVTRAWHILALRVLQGFFAGYGGLTMAMAAESAPRERLARALGLVQTAQRIGPALGPVIGGSVAGVVGLRSSFLVTSGFYAAALVLVTVLYREPAREGRRPPARQAAARTGWRMLLTKPGFPAMMAAIFVLTFVDRSFGPILPLWIEQRGAPHPNVAVAAGAVFSAAALGAAVGNVACEALLRRIAVIPLIVGAAISAAVALGLLVLAPTAGVMAVVMAAFGMAIGVALTAAYTEGGRHVPAEIHGEGFGVLNAGTLAGLALSPVVAGLLSKAALGWVFGIDLALLTGLAFCLARRVRAAPAPAGSTRGGGGQAT